MTFFLAFETISYSAILADICADLLDVYCGGFAFGAITETIINITFMWYTDYFLTKPTLIILILRGRVIS